MAELPPLPDGFVVNHFIVGLILLVVNFLIHETMRGVPYAHELGLVGEPGNYVPANSAKP